MNKNLVLAIVLAIAATIACSGGGYSAPSGSLFQNTSLALRNDTFAPGTPVGTKKGEACATGYLGVISTGDAGVKAAAAAGGISKIYYVDYKNNNILGSLVQSTCTVVSGD